MYNIELLEIRESFKYLGLEVHSNHKWDECATRCLEAGKRPYYPFGKCVVVEKSNVGSSINTILTLW
mgnify:CR=1 FL=1